MRVEINLLNERRDWLYNKALEKQQIGINKIRVLRSQIMI
jgi:hypothetical protein